MNPTVICYIPKGDYLIFPANSAGHFRAGENVWSVGNRQEELAGAGSPGLLWVCQGGLEAHGDRRGSEQGSAL